MYPSGCCYSGHTLILVFYWRDPVSTSSALQKFFSVQTIAHFAHVALYRYCLDAYLIDIWVCPSCLHPSQFYLHYVIPHIFVRITSIFHSCFFDVRNMKDFFASVTSSTILLYVRAFGLFSGCDLTSYLGLCTHLTITFLSSGLCLDS